jgi:RNA polymerase sigma factor (sigma-70 family)
MGGTAEPADAELVGRALGGEREAFEALYRRYHAIVYRFARSMTGSAPMAEDVTQEVFVALMRDLARYEPQRAGLSTYLYGVARNVTRARLRREQRFVNLDEMSSETSEPAARDDPSAALARSQDLIRLRKAIVCIEAACCWPSAFGVASRKVRGRSPVVWRGVSHERSEVADGGSRTFLARIGCGRLPHAGATARSRGGDADVGRREAVRPASTSPAQPPRGPACGRIPGRCGLGCGGDVSRAVRAESD